ncbi:hypothetical protein [Chondromyces crocatus]|uniref:Uncharacterized protein n=1 Tax=Chondromyces crocatus TaxID=52 RepID=A0A0K1EDZ3_CHOCO|nr:hypothetical protein [Chondromyces crocatus]AKT39080.1 uncharacterized protein CMC5_032270 [Chondromyces crocatus]
MTSAPLATPPSALVADAPAPPRVAICVDCRTLLSEGERCDGGLTHRVTSLATAEGRAKLTDEVWGPPSARRRARQLAKAGGGGAGIGSFLEGCNACDVPTSSEGLAIALFVLIAGLVSLLLYWVGAKIVEAIRAHQNRPKPHGGLLWPASVGRRAGPAGVITRLLPDPAAPSDVRRLALRAPAGRENCAAYAIDLRCKRFLRSDIMLHAAESAGFEVRLDDGSVAHVPAGRIRLEGPAVRRRRGAASAVEQYVEALAPRRSEPDDVEPFPYDFVDEITARPGDRVRLFGAWERMAVPGTPAGYRAVAPVVLVPQDVPALRLEVNDPPSK